MRGERAASLEAPCQYPSPSFSSFTLFSKRKSPLPQGARGSKGIARWVTSGRPRKAPAIVTPVRAGGDKIFWNKFLDTGPALLSSSPHPRPRRGALMRRLKRGAGCGARAPSPQLGTRDAPVGTVGTMTVCPPPPADLYQGRVRGKRDLRVGMSPPEEARPGVFQDAAAGVSPTPQNTGLPDER